MREYVFGSGQLYATDTDGLNPIKFGTLQDVSVMFSGDLKELHGQFGMPVAVGRGKQKIEIKAGNGDIDVNLYNNLYFKSTTGSGGTVATGSYAQAVDEQVTPEAAVGAISSTGLVQAAGTATATFGAPHGFLVGEDITVSGATAAGYNVASAPVLSVPSPTTLTYPVPAGTTSPATVQGSFTSAAAKEFVANAATFYRDLGVQYTSSGINLQQVLTSPTVGQYVVNPATGLYTFNASDEGVAMTVNYVYKVLTGQTLTMKNQLIGTEPTFQLLLSETFEGDWLMMQYNAVKCGKLSQPLKLDDFSLADLEMSAFADATNSLGWMSTSVVP